MIFGCPDLLKSGSPLSRNCGSSGLPSTRMLNKDFKEFAELLNSTGVEYMVVGGYALAAYGHPRYTGDLDIWLRRTPENARKVIEALKLFGFGGLGLSEQDFLVPDAVIQLGYPPARIDLLTSIDGVDFDQCYANRIVTMLQGTALAFIGIEDFRSNKRASGRHKDLADLDSLDDSEKPRRA